VLASNPSNHTDNNIYNNNDNSMNDNYMQADYKQRLQDVIPTAPVLQLEVISSASLPKGNTITINALGLFGQW
jgi:hypothetical protein